MRNKIADYKWDKIADFQNEIKQPIFKMGQWYLLKINVASKESYNIHLIGSIQHYVGLAKSAIFSRFKSGYFVPFSE